MSMLYMIAIFTTIALGCVVLGLAATTLATRRRSDDRQAKLSPVRQKLSQLLDEYLSGSLAIGHLAQQLHEHRPLAQGLLLSRAARAAPQDEEKLHAVFRRMSFDQAAIDELSDRQPDRRIDAAIRLGYMGRGRGVGSLLHAVNDEDSRVRLAAAQGLSHLHLGDATMPILRATAGEDGIPLSKATELLVGLGTAAVRPLCDFLDTPASIKSVPSGMVIAACSALGMIGSERCIQSVSRYANHPSANVRAAVARALGGSGSPLAKEALMGLMHDKAWEVRGQAVRGMTRMRDEDECSAALVAATADSSWWVRQNAAHALGEQGRKGVGSLLAILNESPDIYARDAARQALEEKSIILPNGVTLQ